MKNMTERKRRYLDTNNLQEIQKLIGLISKWDE